MSYFVLQLPLQTEIYQEHILNKRFEIGRQIYNALVNITQKRYKEMIKTKLYRATKEELRELYKSKKKENGKSDKKSKREIELCKQLTELRKEYKFSEFHFYNDVKNMQKHFKENIDSLTARNVAYNVWRSYEKLLFGNGETIHYKKHDSLNSLEGCTNEQGIRFRNNNILWNKLSISVKINFNNLYQIEALKNEIAYCRLVRKFVRTKYKFYVQLVLKGIPSHKNNKELGTNVVGIDIGVQTVAISSEKDVKLYELADRIQNIENQKRVILRKMDRSRRSMNPLNYNNDGTIKKQGNKKVIWKRSNHYLKAKNQLKELYRKQADIRKLQHESLANDILKLGDTFYIETMDFAELQKKPKKNKNKKRKGGFGKSLANKAPAMFVSILDRKLGYYGKTLQKVDSYSVKASQFNHFDETYTKKELSQRWNNLNGVMIQRDCYSSFLLMNMNEDLNTINVERCQETFDNFLNLHNKEVERLRGKKNVRSIGI